jgi:hypothetical protein
MIYLKKIRRPSISIEINQAQTSFGNTSHPQHLCMSAIATLFRLLTHYISLIKATQNLICLVKTNSPETNCNIAQQPVLLNSSNLPKKIPKPK